MNNVSKGAGPLPKSLAPEELGEIAITGCSSGIGRALALEFHARGYRVLATARRFESLIELASRGIETASLDVTDPSSIERLGLDARGVGMLINNAGFGAMGAMLDVPLDGLRKQYETNVVSILALTQAVAPSMIRAGRGRIANVSSVSGVLVTPFSGAYCSSKSALNAMSDALRMELAPFGVDVITVQPGAIRSSFGDNAAATVDRDAMARGPYASVAEAVAARATASQKGAMPAEKFARRVADELLARRAPTTVRCGPYSEVFPLVRRWLPERVRDAYLSRRFGLGKLQKPVDRSS